MTQIPEFFITADQSETSSSEIDVAFAIRREYLFSSGRWYNNTATASETVNTQTEEPARC